MVTMENSDEILQILERFTRLKQKEIPKELDDYLQYVAKTGDTIFKWSSLKYLFREKLLHVIKHFNEDSPRLEGKLMLVGKVECNADELNLGRYYMKFTEIPNYPNVDPFNYETMKSSLLERLDLFNSAPFTVQRLCELLIDPRKQYSRIDKFMRALEKNILVVSTVEPGRKRTESENGDSLDSVVNGDLSLEVNIDIEMENEAIFNNVDERNGTGDESGSGTLKASCPRSDDAVQPKAKKAKLEYDDDDERPEAAANTDDMEDEPEGALEAALKAKPVVHNIAVTIEGEETAAAGDAKVAAEKKSVADAQQQTAENEEADDEEAEAKHAKKSLNGDDKHKDDEPAKDETDAVKAVATAKDAEQSEDEEDEPAAEAAVKKADVKEAADKSEDKVVTADAESAAADEKKEKIVEKTDIKEAEKPDKAADKPALADAAEEKQIKSVTADAKDESPIKAAKETAAGQEAKKLDSETKVEELKAKAVEATAAKQSSEPADKDSTLETKTTETASGTVADEAAETETAEATTVKAVASAASDNGNTEKTENEAVAKADVAKPKAAVAAEVPAITPAVPIETNEPAAVTATVAATTPPPPAATAPPTLALNDQPMEDTPADEESSNSPSAAVEEVVMAESGAAATEMATAMEVDDTSQDMDQ